MLNVQFGACAASRARFGNQSPVSEEAMKKVEEFLLELDPNLSGFDLDVQLSRLIGPTYFFPIPRDDKYKAMQSIAGSSGKYAPETTELAKRCMNALKNFYAEPRG